MSSPPPPPPTDTTEVTEATDADIEELSEEALQQRQNGTLLLVHASAPITNKGDDAHRAFCKSYLGFQGTRLTLLEKPPQALQPQPPTAVSASENDGEVSKPRRTAENAPPESIYGDSMSEYFMSSALDPRAQLALGFHARSFTSEDESFGESVRKRRRVDENSPPSRVLVPESPVYRPLSFHGFSQAPLAQSTAEGLVGAAAVHEPTVLPETPYRLSGVDLSVIPSSVPTSSGSQSKHINGAKEPTIPVEPSQQQSTQYSDVTIFSSAVVEDSQPSFRGYSNSQTNSQSQSKSQTQGKSQCQTRLQSQNASQNTSQNNKILQGKAAKVTENVLQNGYAATAEHELPPNPVQVAASPETPHYRPPLAEVYETPFISKTPAVVPATVEYRYKQPAPNPESLSPLSSLASSLPSTGASPNAYPNRFPLFTGIAPPRTTLLELLRRQARTTTAATNATTNITTTSTTLASSFSHHFSPTNESPVETFFIFPLLPETDSNPEIITRTMSAITRKDPTITRYFQPKTQKRNLSPLERGHWRVDLRKWSKEYKVNSTKTGNVERKTLSDRKLRFWAQLSEHVQAGRLGDTRVYFEDFHEGCEDGFGDVIRVYCFGEAVIHIWLVLFITSDRAIAYSDLQWVDAAGDAIIIM